MGSTAIGKRPPWLALGAGLVALLVAAGLGWTYSRIEPYARIGSTYIAKQMCSCLYVAGRSQGSCRAEFQPDINRFTVVADASHLPARARVTTSVAVLFHGEATYAQGYGCTISR